MFGRWKPLTLLILLIKALAFTLFCLVTSFVILYGKNGTGVKLYYAFFAVLVWGVMLV